MALRACTREGQGRCWYPEAGFWEQYARTREGWGLSNRK